MQTKFKARRKSCIAQKKLRISLCIQNFQPIGVNRQSFINVCNSGLYLHEEIMKHVKKELKNRIKIEKEKEVEYGMSGMKDLDFTPGLRKFDSNERFRFND